MLSTYSHSLESHCLNDACRIKWAKKVEVLMAKSGREIIKLKSTESPEVYWTIKNKKTKTERLELKKYDKRLKKHVVFKEAK